MHEIGFLYLKHVVVSVNENFEKRLVNAYSTRSVAIVPR